MGFARFPDNATITWHGAGTYSTSGVYTAGAESSLVIDCRVEYGSPKYVVDDNGGKTEYTMTVYCPASLGINSEYIGRRLQFAGKSYKIIDVPPSQKYTEIGCL